MSSAVIPSTNAHLLAWVAEIQALCKPDRVHWCDGSQEEYDRLCDQMVASGHVHPAESREAARTATCADPTRATSRASSTAPSSRRGRKGDAGPTNNWMDPQEMKAILQQPLDGLHARPHDVRDAVQHGPDRLADRAARRPAHRLALRGRQHAHHDAHGPGRRSTRSATRATSCPCVHSVGMPLEPGQPDVPWPCNPENTYIAHFPEERLIWSFGSGYGGNALLGKKCFALRIASVMARDEGWLAEHMLIVGVERPARREDVRLRRVPERVRQDELRDADPAGRVRGLEGLDGRRRHRLDQAGAGRPHLRHQPGGRLLRRRARHVVASRTRTRWRRSRPTASSPTSRSPTTATCGGRA